MSWRMEWQVLANNHFKAHHTHILATKKWFLYGDSQSPALIIFKGEWVHGFNQHMDTLLVKLIKKTTECGFNFQSLVIWWVQSLRFLQMKSFITQSKNSVLYIKLIVLYKVI